MANQIWTSILNIVNSAGSAVASSPSTAINAIKSILGSNMVSAVTQDLSEIQEVYGVDQDSVDKLVLQVITTQGFPSHLMPLVLRLKTAGLDPLTVQQIVMAIEAGAAAG